MRTEHAAHYSGLPEGDMPERGSCDGRLIPWTDLVTGALGWQMLTASRRLAVAVATLTGGTVHSHEQGEWHARIPQSILTIEVIGASAGTLRCRFGTQPPLGVFILAFAPWPTATVLKCPMTTFPAQGQLWVRDVRVTTRMGRTVRYLIPAFTTTEKGGASST
jgi:hypothetical protein